MAFTAAFGSRAWMISRRRLAFNDSFTHFTRTMIEAAPFSLWTRQAEIRWPLWRPWTSHQGYHRPHDPSCQIRRWALHRFLRCSSGNRRWERRRWFSCHSWSVAPWRTSWWQSWAAWPQHHWRENGKNTSKSHSNSAHLSPLGGCVDWKVNGSPTQQSLQGKISRLCGMQPGLRMRARLGFPLKWVTRIYLASNQALASPAGIPGRIEWSRNACVGGSSSPAFAQRHHCGKPIHSRMAAMQTRTWTTGHGRRITECYSPPASVEERNPRITLSLAHPPRWSKWPVPQHYFTFLAPTGDLQSYAAGQLMIVVPVHFKADCNIVWLVQFWVVAIHHSI